MAEGCLKMYLPRLYYPPYRFCYVYTCRTHCKARVSPSLAIPSSSILSQTDESDDVPKYNKISRSNTVLESRNTLGCLSSQAKTVGIIGGVSVGGTLKFLRKLVEWGSKDGEYNLPFLLCSDPVLNEEISSLEWTLNPSLKGRNDKSAFEHRAIIDNLCNKRLFLENSGASCIVMPCHICNSWYNEISKGCSVPFLHVGDCVAKELKDAKLKPLEAGSRLRIGLLAANLTLVAGFYQDKLLNEGFEVVLPDKATMEHTVIPAVEALKRHDIEGAQNLLRIALQVLLVRGVNTIILASEDLQNLLPREDPLLKRCVDPLDALARSTINWVQSSNNPT